MRIDYAFIYFYNATKTKSSWLVPSSKGVVVLTECAILATKIRKAKKQHNETLERYSSCLTAKIRAIEEEEALICKIQNINQRINDLTEKIAPILISIDPHSNCVTWKEVRIKKGYLLHIFYGFGKKFSYPHGHVIVDVIDLYIINYRFIHEKHKKRKVRKKSLNYIYS